MAALASLGLRPRRRYGQNFLIDGNLMRRLVDSAELAPDDVVLEVGGGTGGLTDLLAAGGGSVICVEIDPHLANLLEVRFGSSDRVEVLCDDALQTKNRLSPRLLQALTARTLTCGRRVVLVANLPYQIATPLLSNLLLEVPQVRRMCFTVQAEVGDRMLAPPGSRDYGPVSVLMQLCCAIQRIARVPPTAFWPSPQVDSVMLRADVIDPAPLSREALRRFCLLVRGAFEHRRKTLKSALAYVIGEQAVARLGEQGVDLRRRPQDVSVHEWVRLFQQT